MKFVFAFINFVLCVIAYQMQTNPIAIIIGCYTGWYVCRRKFYWALALQFIAILVSIAQPLYVLNTVGGIFPSDYYYNNGFVLAGFLVILWIFSKIKFKAKIKKIWEQYPNAMRNLTNEVACEKCGTSNLMKILDYDEKYYAQLEAKIICETLQKKYPYGFDKYKNTLKHTEQDCIKNEEEIQRLQSDILKFNILKEKYPYAVLVYTVKHKYSSVIESTLSSIPERKFQELEERYKKASEYKEWEEKQGEFTKDSRNACLDGWWCYSYKLEFDMPNEDGTTKKGNFLLWQHFEESYCDDTELDNSYCSSQKKHYEELPGLIACDIHFINSVYEKVLSFIKRIKEKYNNLIVVFGDSNLSENEVEAFNDYHFGYLKEILSQNKIKFSESISSIGKLNEPFQPIVVVELISTNVHIKEQCQYLMKLEGGHSCLTFVSLEKGYDKEEMVRLIEKEKSNKQKEEEERKRKEREEKEAEERKRNALASLIECVSSWDTLAYNFPYNYLLHYYPTTCDFEATGDEWADRWLVWNFKNTPGKTSYCQHEQALNNLLPRLTNMLTSTFGSKLQFLTLVCIPAASKTNNNARYRDFSERLTDATGMNNAFDRILIIKDSIPKHLGGTGSPVLHFDKEYFNNRYIILFDDVITTGKSMLIFKRKLEKLGATVIAGVAIGITTHERW